MTLFRRDPLSPEDVSSITTALLAERDEAPVMREAESVLPVSTSAPGVGLLERDVMPTAIP